MYPFIYLFKLFLVIILNTLQACFFHRGQQDLSKQTPSYTVSFRSDNQKGYFEDQRIPIDILFIPEDEHIQNNDMGIRIKNISIEGVSGHLETKTGAVLENGFDFVYTSDGYPLFFVPDVDEDSGHCAITLDTLLIDKYGNEAPDTAKKTANCHLYICHKEDSIEATRQEDETKFSETVKPLSEDHSNRALPATTVSLEANDYVFQDAEFFTQIS